VFSSQGSPSSSLFVVCQGLVALSFAIVMTKWLSNFAPFDELTTPKQFHDLGKLTHGFIIFWAYASFSQFLIMWSANLPEETTWYVARTHGGWGKIAVAMAILQFAFPLMLLLSRATKKSGQRLAMLAALILVMRLVDAVWLVEPTYSHGHFAFNWMDLVAPLAIGGLWTGTFAWQLQKRPLVPFNDPQLEQALVAAHGH